MRNLYTFLEWLGLILGGVLAGSAIAVLRVRRRIVKQVETELGKGTLLLAAGARVDIPVPQTGNGGSGARLREEGASGMRSTAVRSAARASSATRTATVSASGVLMLLSKGLYFHSWIGHHQVFIAGASISWIGVTQAPSGHRSARPCIAVRYLRADGKEDGITIRLVSPAQWVSAIKTHLITRSE